MRCYYVHSCCCHCHRCSSALPFTRAEAPDEQGRWTTGPVRARGMEACSLWGPEPLTHGGHGVFIGSMSEYPSLGAPSFSDASPSKLYPIQEPQKWLLYPTSQHQTTTEQSPNSAPSQLATGLTSVVSPLTHNLILANWMAPLSSITLFFQSFWYALGSHEWW